MHLSLDLTRFASTRFASTRFDPARFDPAYVASNQILGWNQNWPPKFAQQNCPREFPNQFPLGQFSNWQIWH